MPKNSGHWVRGVFVWGQATEGATLRAAVMGVLPNVQRSWTGVPIQAVGTFAPNAQGWAIANPTWQSVELDLTLQPADLNDASLQIACGIEWSTDPTGNSGWDTLTAGTWNGGPTGRDQTAKQPQYGLTPDKWPPGMQRARLHAVPTRNIASVDAVVSAS